MARALHRLNVLVAVSVTVTSAIVVPRPVPAIAAVPPCLATVAGPDTTPPARPGAAPAVVRYQPPVSGPVVDAFRPPATPYGPGNRGLDYATTPGEAVGAAADGRVVFAGQVGGELHVVVLHADGIRTSYSYLATVGARRDDVVGRGQAVGTAGTALHFGARLDGAYLDPATLFAPSSRAPAVHLVPDGPGHPLGQAEEQRGLQQWLRATGATRAGTLAAATAATAARRGVAAAGVASNAVLGALAAIGAPTAWQVLDAAARERADSRPCTEAAAAPPPPAPGARAGHVLILVGGLGSAAGAAAVLDVNPQALGFAAGDVVQFSYRGGRADEHPYGPADTFTGIEPAGRLLLALFADLARQRPGCVIDVVAHSQGGLVARWAVTHVPDGPRFSVGTVVTLGAPHGGADLARAAAVVATTAGGRRAETAAAEAVAGLDPTAPSVVDLAPGSTFLTELARRPLPTGTRVVSVAARTDLVVPSSRSHLDGARTVVVTLPGPIDAHAHDRLPGSAPAARELALAFAGRDPTCRSDVDIALDAVASVGTVQAEAAAGLAVGAGTAVLPP